MVFGKRNRGRDWLGYEEAVQEALCFGWIDSLVKRINDDRYCRKFTPRKDDSAWSNTNKRRVEKIAKEGGMTKFGQEKVDAAKRSRRWAIDSGPGVTMDVPQELSRALGRNRNARDFFEKLAPTYRKHFIGWIVTAKRAETRAKRVRESEALLTRAQKLGLK